MSEQVDVIVIGLGVTPSIKTTTASELHLSRSEAVSVGLTGFEPATPWRDRAYFFKASESGKFADSLVISRD